MVEERFQRLPTEALEDPSAKKLMGAEKSQPEGDITLRGLQAPHTVKQIKKVISLISILWCIKRESWG